MTKSKEDKIQEIIQHIVSVEEYNKICDTYGGKYAEDLFQEFCMAILETNNVDKLYDMFQRGQLLYYCVTMIKNMVVNTYSPYYKKIVKFNALSSELPIHNTQKDEEYEEPIELTKVMDSLSEPLNQIDEWFQNKIKENHRYNYQYTLFKMHYYDNLSYRAIERKIFEETGHKGIRYVSIFYSIKEVVKEMMEDLSFEELNYL